MRYRSADHAAGELGMTPDRFQILSQRLGYGVAMIIDDTPFFHQETVDAVRDYLASQRQREEASSARVG